MSFLRRLLGGRSGDQTAPREVEETADVLWIYVQCERCGERLRIRVNKASDLSDAADTVDEGGDDGADENAPPSSYLLRKEILGNDCPRLMHVRATFDSRRRLLEMTAEGCKLITREEYEAGRQDTGTR